MVAQQGAVPEAAQRLGGEREQALGAGASGVLLAVVRQSVVLAGAGSLLGGGIALLATRAIESMLFGVTPADAATYVTTLVLVLLVVLGASALPAWRAARISPVGALSAE